MSLATAALAHIVVATAFAPPLVDQPNSAKRAGLWKQGHRQGTRRPHATMQTAPGHHHVCRAESVVARRQCILNGLGLWAGLVAQPTRAWAEDGSAEQAAAPQSTSATAIFSGGDARFLQAVFETKRPNGVLSTSIGRVADGTRAVRVTYDPAKCSYKVLLGVFWRNVDPTDGNGKRECKRYGRCVLHVLTVHGRYRAIQRSGRGIQACDLCKQCGGAIASRAVYENSGCLRYHGEGTLRSCVRVRALQYVPCRPLVFCVVYTCTHTRIQTRARTHTQVFMVKARHALLCHLPSKSRHVCVCSAFVCMFVYVCVSVCAFVTPRQRQRE